MKTYRNEQLGFEMEIPEEWYLDSVEKVSTAIGEGFLVVFTCRINEAFNIQVGKSTSEPSQDQTEIEFGQFVQKQDYSSLILGRILVQGREYVWARYYLGNGVWTKKYKIILGETEYAITATCLDQNYLLGMEKDWDAVAGSFRLISMQPPDLSEIMQELSQPAQPDEMPKRIELCEQALRLVSRQAEPERWARLQRELAKSLSRDPRGDRAENIEKAIPLYLEALQVYTPQDFPVDWAVTQNYLAFAYEDRIQGDRAENIERSIDYYQQALKIFTQQIYPEQWASTQTNLASAYTLRQNGRREENLDLAAGHCQQALEVHTLHANPDQWAMHQILLATIAMDRKRGTIAEYTAQAVQYYQQALQVFTQDKYPEEWAMVQGGLAFANQAAGQVDHPARLSYPQFYDEETQQQPGLKCTLKLVQSIIPDSPFLTILWLFYQWEEDLPNDEANRMAQRAIAYIACAIYDAASSAGWPCQPSPIPNGRRPAWILDGERSPVSLTLSDIDLTGKSCQFTIGAVIIENGKPPGDRAHWEKLHAAFQARFAEITV